MCTVDSGSVKNRAKEQVILHVNKLPLHFLCSFSQDRLMILFQ